MNSSQIGHLVGAVKTAMVHHRWLQLKIFRKTGKPIRPPYPWAYDAGRMALLPTGDTPVQGNTGSWLFRGHGNKISDAKFFEESRRDSGMGIGRYVLEVVKLVLGSSDDTYPIGLPNGVKLSRDQPHVSYVYSLERAEIGKGREVSAIIQLNRKGNLEDYTIGYYLPSYDFDSVDGFVAIHTDNLIHEFVHWGMDNKPCSLDHCERWRPWTRQLTADSMRRTVWGVDSEL